MKGHKYQLTRDDARRCGGGYRLWKYRVKIEKIGGYWQATSKRPKKSVSNTTVDFWHWAAEPETFLEPGDGPLTVRLTIDVEP